MDANGEMAGIVPPAIRPRGETIGLIAPDHEMQSREDVCPLKLSLHEDIAEAPF